ncbi:MAG: tetratricopeptide repeat protein [candidate division KSB1 bacterium]|nr:tetratricopeptide repeat protein [candidate division KSB1 bacterium]
MTAKKTFRTVFAVLAALVMFSTASLLASTPPQAQKLLNKARKDIARQKFEKAEKHLRRLLSQFPNSDLADDAVFWQAYIQEARDRDLTAFQQFAELRQRFPDSEWADNALAHQIRIAQKLYLSGRPQYKRFLTGLLHQDDARIRAEAALSLAELGRFHRRGTGADFSRCGRSLAAAARNPCPGNRSQRSGAGPSGQPTRAPGAAAVSDPRRQSRPRRAQKKLARGIHALQNAAVSAVRSPV